MAVLQTLRLFDLETKLELSQQRAPNSAVFVCFKKYMPEDMDKRTKTQNSLFSV